MAAEERQGQEAEAFPEKEVRLECEFHGPLRHRPDQRLWICVGFDGEGCRQRGTCEGIPDDAAARLAAERTYWPGVNVNGKHWEQVRGELRQRREEHDGGDR